MKNLFYCLLFMVFATTAKAQLKTTPVCPVMVVDILEGNVNGIEPNFSTTDIKKAFPCFTAEEPEGTTAACGGLISYKDKDIYFYTTKAYIEIREKFKGKLSLPLMGAARSSLFKLLGHPKIKDVNWDAFQTKYGILILYYNKTSRINKIQFSRKTTDTINLCE
jgi:hypothetical protein